MLINRFHIFLFSLSHKNCHNSFLEKALAHISINIPIFSLHLKHEKNAAIYYYIISLILIIFNLIRIFSLIKKKKQIEIHERN